MIRRNKSVKTTTFQQPPQPGGASMPYRRPSSNKNLNNNSGHTKKVGAHNNIHNAHAAEALEKRRNESQVGSKMRELTGQRVAFGIILALLFSVFFTYVEKDTTRPLTMIILHRQTSNPLFAEKALNAARKSSIPDLILYGYADGTEELFDVKGEISNVEELRPRERLRITVETAGDGTNPTYALFSLRNERQDEAIVSLLSTVFIIMVWFFGVGSFAGPVMVLVVIPIERMVKLLGMLTLDPLGYQSTSRYKRFLDEENELTKNTRWTKEILKGMETSFLMSTILRIGSLMKVGFGSAGVEIIRNNLEPGQSKNTLILSSQGSTVSCIFLFCDIRNFTDATECLQEEVFVFTNRIAAVVHSFCHAYGGSANKNVGDAFLISWQLEEDLSSASSNMGVQDGHDSFSWSQHQGSLGKSDGFIAKNNQADKALLSVVKICMALYYDNYFIETLSKGARDALVSKLKHRQGPVVQMGFGMHAGRAVQGAIGSQRKIDPTYVSEAVERAEFLESSTKKYGVKLLMSESFHRLLHTSNRRRCRKVDQIIIRDDDEADDDDLTLNGEIMELFTFDVRDTYTPACIANC
jgi:class 3 adenylate cyclase/predicted small integral membrane protein